MWGGEGNFYCCGIVKEMICEMFLGNEILESVILLRKFLSVFGKPRGGHTPPPRSFLLKLIAGIRIGTPTRSFLLQLIAGIRIGFKP